MDRLPRKDLARLPLAEAVLLLGRWVMSRERLESLWERHRGRCYERAFSFEVMVRWVAEALLNHEGSGRQAFEMGLKPEERPASVQAAFRKLGRLPVALSEGFVSECTAALRSAFPVEAEEELPASLRQFRVIVLDGKAIKYVAKRLKPLRGISSGLLGGRALVAFEWRTGLVVAMRADEDGDANEVKLVEDLVAEVCEQVAGPRLWVADRAFCDLTQPIHFTAHGGDHFLVRYHSKNSFVRDESRGERRGRDAKGRRYVETWGYLGSEKDERRRYVRRIELERPGKEPLILITDLLDPDEYPAEDLLWLYAKRWDMEQVFQELTTVFGLRRLIGGTPKACIFQLAFCVVLYNLIQMVRAYVAAAHEKKRKEISTKKLFNDVVGQLRTWNFLLTPEQTVRYLGPRVSLRQVRKRLLKLLGSTWNDAWRRSPPQKRHGKTPKRPAPKHHSVYRLLQAHTRPTANRTHQPS